jgi:hypothetical protein
MGGIDSELFGKECRGALKSKFLSLYTNGGNNEGKDGSYLGFLVFFQSLGDLNS